MICKNRPIKVFNRNVNDSFASAASVTVIIPCSGMERFSFHGYFTTVPGSAPQVALSGDGVNFDDAMSIALVPTSTSLYKAEIDLHGASFLRLVVVAGPNASDSARINAWLWPESDPNQD